MGMIECKIHGISFMTIVCQDIAKKVEENNLLDKFIVGTIIISRDKSPLKITLTYCQNCAEILKLPSENSEISEARAEEIKEEFFDTVCIKCFAIAAKLK